MKITKNLLAVCALFALLLAVCVPVLSVANADGEDTIIVTISGTKMCYGDNGKQIGVLSPGESAGSQPTYLADDDKEAVAVIVLYNYTAENSVIGSDNMEGKVKVTLQRAPEITPVPADSPDAAASGPEADASVSPDETVEAAPEMVTLPQTELICDVWVDASIVVSALSQAKQQDDSIINELNTQIAKLTGDGVTEEPVATPADIAEGEIDNPDADAAQTGLLPSWLFPIIACVVLLAIAGGVIWSAISAARIARETKKSNDEKNSKNQSLQSMDQSLANLSKQADPASAIDKAMMDPVGKAPYMKLIVENTAETRAILARMEQKTDFAPQPEQRLTDPYTVKRREAIALANSLAGIAAREDWADILVQSGYRYVLVQTDPTSQNVLRENKAEASVLACLMKGSEAEEAYLVPSFEDPNAGENLWKNFYAVTDDASVQHYRIDELAVMKVVNNGAFFTLNTKGKLSRRL